MVEILAEYLNQEPERVEDKIDLVYCIRSLYADNKNLPKDVSVQFITKNERRHIKRTITIHWKLRGGNNHNEGVTEEDGPGQKAF